MKAITAAVLAGVVAIILFQPGFFLRWDQKAKDVLTGWQDGGKPSGEVVTVEIDEKSLSQFGRWPWSRDRLSALLQGIQDAGADTIVLDMVFPEPDLGQPAPHLAPGTSAARSADLPPRWTTTNDDVLAARLRNGRVVIGFHFKFAAVQAAPSRCTLHPLPLVIVESGSTSAPAFFTASGVSCNADELFRAAAGSGFVNATSDSDGVLRRVPLVAEYDKGMYPSLALSGYMTYRRLNQAQLRKDSAGAVALRLDSTEVPVDFRSNLLLRFRGPAGALVRFSAADILNGKAPKDVFRDKVVVVGMSALGLQDMVTTPGNRRVPGFEVHATAIDNLLQNDPLSIPREALATELMLLLLVGLGSGFLLSRLEPTWAAPLVLCLLATVWGGCGVLLAKTNIVLSPFPATLVLLGNLTLLTTWRVSTEKRRAEQQLSITRKFILTALTSLTTIRDVETGAHVVRVQRYVKLLCYALAANPKFRDALTPKNIQLIYELIPVHDIGKVAIPDHILRKPGRLNPTELEIMKAHTIHGNKVLADAACNSGIADEAALRLASEIILAHHERWDGTGYPQGLSGESIPLVGRILAVADVYDAMVCKRVYKEPMTHQAALKHLVKNRGIQFDPVILDAFVQIEEAIRRTKTECEDEVGLTAVNSSPQH